MHATAMTASGTSISAAAAALRREFDQGFAHTPLAGATDTESMLAVRIADDPYVLRLREIAALHADRRVVALPTALPECLGVVGLRGQIAGVYDLATLLGYTARREPRWLVLVRQRESVALAFEAFETQLLVPVAGILAADASTHSRPHVHGAVRVDGAVRPLVHLPSVLEEIRKRVAISHPSQER